MINYSKRRLMHSFLLWLQKTLNLSQDLLFKILLSLAVVLLLWLIRQLVQRIIWRKVENLYRKYRLRKNLGYVIFFTGFLLILRIWVAGIGSFATYLGLLSAGLAIALKDFVANLAGWIFIMWRKPFEVGDRIQIGQQMGDVIDIRIFAFTLMEIGADRVSAEQSTGRVVHIPNGKVMTEHLANYSKGFKYIWNEIPVLITFESNWRAAKETVLDIGNSHAMHLSERAEKKVKEASKKFLIFYNKLTPMVYVAVKASGVEITLRYLCEPKSKRMTENLIWQDILSAFEKNPDIEFAYPTYRYYDNSIESKSSIEKAEMENPE